MAVRATLATPFHPSLPNSSMPNDALLAVLLGACLHASWNAAIKSGRDKFLDMILVATGAGIIAAFALAVPASARRCQHPLSDRLEYLANRLLPADRGGVPDGRHELRLSADARHGSAHRCVASGVVVGEQLSGRAWMGVLLIAGGVLALTALYRRAAPSLFRPLSRSAMPS